MVVFDSNIFIYAGQGKIKASLLARTEACYASITTIEVLGFHDITAVEQRMLSRILAAYQSIDLSEAIIQRAVMLRQDRSISLGDAIVAATVLEQKATLWTANTRDFDHIEGLKLHNPVIDAG